MEPPAIEWQIREVNQDGGQGFWSKHRHTSESCFHYYGLPYVEDKVI